MGTIQTPIVVEDGAWIAAFALIAGNVTIGQEALVTMGAVVYSDCEPRGAYRGNPAQRVGTPADPRRAGGQADARTIAPSKCVRSSAPDAATPAPVRPRSLARTSPS